MSRKLNIASVAFTTWLMVVIAALLFSGTLDLEIFFALAVVGMLVVVVLIDLSMVQPRYMRRVKYLVATALVVFGYIMATRVVEILGQ